MRRIPIPLILAAIIAVGVAVTIIFQITVLTPPSAVVVLVPQGATTATFHIEDIGVQYVAFPIGMGAMEITFNTTNFYYYNIDDLWSLAVPASKYTNMTGTHEINTRAGTYTLRVFDCGNVVVVGSTLIVYVGQWADFGGYKVAVPVNFTASQHQLACVRKFLHYYSIYNVDVFSPRIDYYEFDGYRIYVYYDYVDIYNHHLKYNRRSFTPYASDGRVLVVGQRVMNPETGVFYLGGYFIGAFSADSSGTYVVTVTGR
ncbi:MAG: hypothetical protein QXR18_09320 [Pyrobaculum sp.]